MLPVKLHDSIVFLYFIPSLTYIGSHRPSIYGQKLAVHHLYLLTAFLHLDLHLPLCWCFSPPWSQTRKRKNQHGGWELGARALNQHPSTSTWAPTHQNKGGGSKGCGFGRQGTRPAPQSPGGSALKKNECHDAVDWIVVLGHSGRLGLAHLYI